MKKTLVVAVALVAVQLAVTYWYIARQERKVVYADTIKLFDAYTFKSDLEKASQRPLAQFQHQLDSIIVLYKIHPEDEGLRQSAAEKQLQLENRYNAINKEINQKVWERLNPLIHQFGKDHDLGIVIGANGMGTVLYASEKKDITDQLIRYINEHYEKGN